MGDRIPIDIYNVDAEDLVKVLLDLPEPLAFGTIDLENGCVVSAILCEPRGVFGAEVINSPSKLHSICQLYHSPIIKEEEEEAADGDEVLLEDLNDDADDEVSLSSRCCDFTRDSRVIDGFSSPSSSSVMMSEDTNFVVMLATIKDSTLFKTLGLQDCRPLSKVLKTASRYKVYSCNSLSCTHLACLHPSIIYQQGNGSSVQLEIYAFSPLDIGFIISRLPGPLGIGTLTLDDGSTVRGIIAESRALHGAVDITAPLTC